MKIDNLNKYIYLKTKWNVSYLNVIHEAKRENKRTELMNPFNYVTFVGHNWLEFLCFCFCCWLSLSIRISLLLYLLLLFFKSIVTSFQFILGTDPKQYQKKIYEIFFISWQISFYLDNSNSISSFFYCHFTWNKQNTAKNKIKFERNPDERRTKHV